MKKLIGLVCVSLLLISALAQNQGKFITDTDMGKTIPKIKGVTFTVKLTSNPSTGYVWVLDGALTNLQQIGKSTYEGKDPKIPPRPGGNQWQVFKFKATKVGLDKIRMRYYRSWEGKKASDKIWSVKINVLDLKKKPIKK
jgi:predicted secreted protein